jgi:hypothetical protein
MLTGKAFKQFISREDTTIAGAYLFADNPRAQSLRQHFAEPIPNRG